MTRHINREKAMYATYQNQIMTRPLKELIEANFGDEEADEYITKVNKFIVRWNYERY